MCLMCSFPQVPEQVKQDRRDELISLVQKSQRAFARRQVLSCTGPQHEWIGCVWMLESRMGSFFVSKSSGPIHDYFIHSSRTVL